MARIVVSMIHDLEFVTILIRALVMYLSSSRILIFQAPQ